MFLDGFDFHLDAGNLYPGQFLDQFRDASVAMRPARRSVILPGASTVQKFPRAATSSADFDPDPERLQHAAADVELQRIVAEQAEVARARAGGDAVSDRMHLPEAAFGREPVQVGGLRGFQFGRSARATGRPPRPSITRSTIFVLAPERATESGQCLP